MNGLPNRADDWPPRSGIPFGTRLRDSKCRIVRIEDRHGKVELRTLADFAFDPQAATVDLDKMLGDG